MLAITGFSKQAVARTQNGSGRDRSDEALIRAIADGDRSAMRVLYTRHHVKVYRFILRLIDDGALAQDLVSEVFIGAWRQAGGFKSKSRVSTWLLAIARNKAFSARSRHRDEQLDDDIASSIADTGDDAEYGLKIGDVILEAGGRKAGSAADLRNAVQAAETAGKSTVLMRVRSGTSAKYVTLPVGRG